MSCLVVERTEFRLTPERLATALEDIKTRLEGRVLEAYVFGSASTGTISGDSDIDLILVKESVDQPFVRRGFEFEDLLEIYPKIDVLVYSRAELDAQLADSETGFWKSVRGSLRRLC